MKEVDGLNTYYYINAASVEQIDGALRCKITRRQIDEVLAKSHEMIVLTPPQFTNGGKPHMCYTVQVHDGNTIGIMLCGKCNLPVDNMI